MKSFAVIAACAVVALALVSPSGVTPAPMPDIPEQGQLIRLPETGTAWHTSVFVHDDWKARANERELVAAFDSVPELASLKSQTFFHIYAESNPHYRERLRRHFPTLPAVVIQRGDGSVAFKASGSSLSPEALTPQIAQSLTERVGGPGTVASTSDQLYQKQCINGRCYYVPVAKPSVPDNSDDKPANEVPDMGSIPALLNRDTAHLAIVALMGVGVAYFCFRK